MPLHKGREEFSEDINDEEGQEHQHHQQELIMVRNDVIVMALHVLCRSHEMIDTFAISQSPTTSAWQNENDHPMLRWEVVLRM